MSAGTNDSSSTIRAVIADVRSRLPKTPSYDAWILANRFANFPEIEQAGLGDLLWLLIHEANVHRNDVAGFVDLLEEWLDENDGYTQETADG